MRSGKNFLQNYVSWKNLNFDLTENFSRFFPCGLFFSTIILKKSFRKKSKLYYINKGKKYPLSAGHIIQISDRFSL